jgi:aryl-alcohol dehydrogenase-like predicted oxidoreductase
MGLLTGKYTAQHPPRGARGFRYHRQYLDRIQPVIATLREIGAARGGKTPAQVALNWSICKGTVPIPGAKNARQAKENIGALGWRLTDTEVAALDAASDRVKR